MTIRSLSTSPPSSNNQNSSSSSSAQTSPEGNPNRSRFTYRRTSGRYGIPNEKLQGEKYKTAFYAVAFVVFCLGGTYLAVPMYRAFCTMTGYGGTPKITTLDQISTLRQKALADRATIVVPHREVTVFFNADVADDLTWSFRPDVPFVKVRIGEPVLAFFTAKNNSDRPIVGVATYNVLPMKAGQYFNKIQCFCFDEQRLRPHEEMPMPVYFFIDPEMEENDKMDFVNRLTLSYTFYKVPDQEDAERRFAAHSIATLEADRQQLQARTPTPLPSASSTVRSQTASSHPSEA